MISLIWAQAANGVIGNAGAIPWRLPEDLSMFRSLTLGSTVLMGRVTWDSLPPGARPLEGRRNLVLTRQADWVAPGAIPVSSFAEAMRQAEGPLWVIGGSQVYADALPFAQRVAMTEVEPAFDGDTYAPSLDATWSVANREPATGWSTSTTGIRYRVTRYERNATAANERLGAEIPLSA
jgi:dihydrofolate reductase